MTRVCGRWYQLHRRGFPEQPIGSGKTIKATLNILVVGERSLTRWPHLGTIDTEAILRPWLTSQIDLRDLRVLDRAIDISV